MIGTTQKYINRITALKKMQSAGVAYRYSNSANRADRKEALEKARLEYQRADAAYAKERNDNIHA